jgi:hypothetical protein
MGAFENFQRPPVHLVEAPELELPDDLAAFGPDRVQAALDCAADVAFVAVAKLVGDLLVGQAALAEATCLAVALGTGEGLGELA